MKALGESEIAFESREYELVQQENGVAKLFEPLEVEVYL
jgi:hypothetical protein